MLRVRQRRTLTDEGKMKKSLYNYYRNFYNYWYFLFHCNHVKLCPDPASFGFLPVSAPMWRSDTPPFRDTVTPLQTPRRTALKKEAGHTL